MVHQDPPPKGQSNEYRDRLTPIIRNLVACRELEEAIAHWFRTEWGNWPQHQSIEKTVRKLNGRLNLDRAPLTLVAFDRNIPIGTGSLILQEMTIHPELPYWLGDLYVIPEYRGRGVGSELMEAVVVAARRLGATEVCLYTEDQEALYSRKGWRTFEHTTYDGHPVVVMKRPT